MMKKNFTQSIIDEIQEIDQNFDASKVDIQPSQHGNTSASLVRCLYLKNQLDLIYSKLSSHPDTKFVI